MAVNRVTEDSSQALLAAQQYSLVFIKVTNVKKCDLKNKDFNIILVALDCDGL